MNKIINKLSNTEKSWIAGFWEGEGHITKRIEGNRNYNISILSL
jgi:hypothetical protein